MARAGVRVIIGLLMAMAVGLMFAPLVWPAGAESAGLTAVAQPFQTVPPTDTTVPQVTAPPSSSSARTTPTTRSPTTRPRVTTTSTSSTSTSTTSTTVAPIPAPAPAPVTLPLASAAQSGSISALFPILSGIGFVSLVGLMTAQWFLTKPGRKGPTL